MEAGREEKKESEEGRFGGRDLTVGYVLYCVGRQDR